MCVMVTRVLVIWEILQNQKNFIANASIILVELSVKCAVLDMFKKNGNQLRLNLQIFVSHVIVIRIQLNAFTAKKWIKTKPVLTYMVNMMVVESALIVCITLKELIVKNANLVIIGLKEEHLMHLMHVKNVAVALIFILVRVMKKLAIVIVKNSTLVKTVIDVAMVIMTFQNVNHVFVFLMALMGMFAIRRRVNVFVKLVSQVLFVKSVQILIMDFQNVKSVNAIFLVRFRRHVTLRQDNAFAKHRTEVELAINAMLAIIIIQIANNATVIVQEPLMRFVTIKVVVVCANQDTQEKNVINVNQTIMVFPTV